jgi:hypothetical protein
VLSIVQPQSSHNHPSSASVFPGSLRNGSTIPLIPIPSDRRAAASNAACRIVETCRRSRNGDRDATPAQSVKNSLTVLRHDSDHDRKEIVIEGSQSCQTWKR